MMHFKFDLTFAVAGSLFGIVEVTYVIAARNRLEALQELSSTLLADERIMPEHLLARIDVTNI